MKTYVSVLIGIVVLFAVVYGGYTFIKKDSERQAAKSQEGIQMRSFVGEVSRFYEGENKIIYSFDIPETATTTLSMDNALIRITDGIAPYATVYVSYEGGRGFTPLDYIGEIISPHVSVINTLDVSTFGVNEWQRAESEGSEWYIASVLNGEWLIVVENKKSVHDSVQKTLTSLKVE